MVDRTKSRSETYQYVLVEIPTDIASLTHLEAPETGADEVMAELRERLIALMWRKAEAILTPRQWDVFRLYFQQGKTQTEISKLLGVNQSSVTKSINGNVDYRHGKVCYGGGIKKLRRYLLTDPEVLALLAEIEAAAP